LTAHARATLARRNGDGFDTATQPVYVPRSGPGEYQFTAPFTIAVQQSADRSGFDVAVLLTTPPVPDYPSTHTVLGWAAAEVLIELLGDNVRFTATSLTLPGPSRQFNALSAAAEENGMSRVYAGIHFRHAVKDGRRQGRSVGHAVAQALAPVGGTRTSM